MISMQLYSENYNMLKHNLFTTNLKHLYVVSGPSINISCELEELLTKLKQKGQFVTYVNLTFDAIFSSHVSRKLNENNKRYFSKFKSIESTDVLEVKNELLKNMKINIGNNIIEDNGILIVEVFSKVNRGDLKYIEKYLKKYQDKLQVIFFLHSEFCDYNSDDEYFEMDILAALYFSGGSLDVLVLKQLFPERKYENYLSFREDKYGKKITYKHKGFMLKARTCYDRLPDKKKRNLSKKILEMNECISNINPLSISINTGSYTQVMKFYNKDYVREMFYHTNNIKDFYKRLYKIAPFDEKGKVLTNYLSLLLIAKKKRKNLLNFFNFFSYNNLFKSLEYADQYLLWFELGQLLSKENEREYRILGKNAIRNAKQCINNIFIEDEDERRKKKAALLNTEALIYFNEGDMHLAKALEERAILLLNDCSSVDVEAIVLKIQSIINYSEILNREGNRKISINNLLKAINLCKSNNVPMEIIEIIFVKLAKKYCENYDFNESNKYLYSALFFYKEIECSNSLKVQLMIAQNYALMGYEKVTTKIFIDIILNKKSTSLELKKSLYKNVMKVRPNLSSIIKEKIMGRINSDKNIDLIIRKLNKIEL